MAVFNVVHGCVWCCPWLCLVLSMAVFGVVHGCVWCCPRLCLVLSMAVFGVVHGCVSVQSCFEVLRLRKTKVAEERGKRCKMRMAAALESRRKDAEAKQKKLMQMEEYWSKVANQAKMRKEQVREP